MEMIDRSMEPRRVADNPAELLYLFEMVPCQRCGTRSSGTFDDWIRENGDPRLTTYIEKCKSCGCLRHVKGWVRNGHPSAPRYTVTLAGPSQVIEPREFLDEITRVSPVLDLDPAKLSVEEWIMRERESTHGLTCANELVKFLIESENSIPNRLLTPEGLADKKGRPEQYTRAYVTEMQKAFLAMDVAFKADAKRFGVEYEKVYPPAMGELSRDTLMAQDQWWRSGRVGPPPLTLKHQKFQKLRDRGFAGCDLDDIVFDHCFAAYVNFKEAKLKDVKFLTCNVQSSMIERANLEGVIVEDSWLHRLDSDGARVNRSRFVRTSFALASLDSSLWEDVAFEQCDFLATGFVGTTLRRCTFTPGTYMGINEEWKLLGKTNGAIFEDCDLREVKLHGRDLSGATFTRCKLAGATGAPRAAEGLVLQDCDLSRDKFLSALAAPVTT